ncbi:MAG: Abi family protein [Motiliproteus sp.]
MQGLNAIEIAEYISQPRLKSYVTLLDGDPIQLRELIGLYNWNKALSSALYPMLQCLEVSIRNAVHERATSHFGTSDWYAPLISAVSDDKYRDELSNDPTLDIRFYRKAVSVGKRNRRRRWASHLENQLATAERRLTNAGKKISADGVISETMFGFWTGVFEAKFRDVTSTNRLWPHLEQAVFPYAKPRQRDSVYVYSKLDGIRELRNRLSHHEPIWKDKSVTRSADALAFLKQSAEDIVDLIGYISKDRRELLVRTGMPGRFFGLLDPKALSAYRNHERNSVIHKSKLRRELNKLLKPGLLNKETLTVTVRGKPVATVTPTCI